MCRRCTECEGYSHHWIDNPDFTGELTDPVGRAELACKHCKALGEECWKCEGSGVAEGVSIEDMPDLDEEDFCPRCNGEGVICISEEAGQSP